jgi:hypothetical protein
VGGGNGTDGVGVVATGAVVEVAAAVAGAVVGAGGVVVGAGGAVVGVVEGGVVVGVVEGGVVVGAEVDGLDVGDDVEVDDGDAPSVVTPAAVVAAAFARVAPPRVPAECAEVVAVDDVPVVPASDAMTPATVEVGATTGGLPPTVRGTAGPEPAGGAGSAALGCVVLRGEWDVESGVESSARATGAATHGSRSPGRTGPPRRPTARTAT